MIYCLYMCVRLICSLIYVAATYEVYIFEAGGDPQACDFGCFCTNYVWYWIGIICERFSILKISCCTVAPMQVITRRSCYCIFRFAHYVVPLLVSF